MSLDVYLTEMRETSIFESNITHNLTTMADAAGLYKALWRPDELFIEYAEDLIPLLRAGLEQLRNDPEKFRALAPSNKWGNYEGLIEFTRSYLEACECNPRAKIHVSR